MNDLTVCAEIGSSWRVDDLAESHLLALSAIHQAAEAGATAVKFQLFDADRFYSKERAPKQYEHAVRYQLPVDWIQGLSDVAHELHLNFWLSVFDVMSASKAAPY